MDAIKVQYIVDQKAAVLAGQKFYGTIETTIDPAALTPEQRAELAQCATVSDVFVLNKNQDSVGDLRLGTQDDAHIVTILDTRIRVRKTKEAALEKERAEHYARYAALLSGNDRAEVLEKLVRGQKPGWIFPGSTTHAEKWWSDHQAEYAAAMAVIRENIERKEHEEKVRLDRIVAERRAQLLADGIDGMLKKGSEGWYRVTNPGGDAVSTWEKRGNPEVMALIAQASAEANRRDEAEKTARQDQIAAWVAKKGTENQKGRHALNLLPEDEVLDAMRDEAFAALDSFPRYEKIKKGDIDHDEYCEAGITCDVNDAGALTAEEYDIFAAIRLAAPQGAEVSALSHDCECKSDDCDATLSRKSVKVSMIVGDLIFTREYAL